MIILLSTIYKEFIMRSLFPCSVTEIKAIFSFKLTLSSNKNIFESLMDCDFGLYNLIWLVSHVITTGNLVTILVNFT